MRDYMAPPVRKELLEAARKADPTLSNLQLEEEETETDESEESVVPDETKTPAEEPEGSEPPEGGDDDDLSKFPENWFGENIRQYAEENGVEAAEAYFKGLKDADRVASRRLQEIAEIRKQAEQEAAEAARKQRVVDETPANEDEPPTDEELLTEAGIDPSIAQYDEGKAIVAVLRRQYELENTVRSQTEAAQNQAWEQQFFGRLDELQAKEGKITDDEGNPVSNQDLFELAVETNIYNPDGLYWYLAGPVKSAKPKVPKDPARRDIKRAIGQPRRRGGQGIETAKPKTLAEHFQNAKKVTGVKGDPFAF